MGTQLEEKEMVDTSMVSLMVRVISSKREQGLKLRENGGGLRISTSIPINLVTFEISSRLTIVSGRFVRLELHR